MVCEKRNRGLWGGGRIPPCRRLVLRDLEKRGKGVGDKPRARNACFPAKKVTLKGEEEIFRFEKGTFDGGNYNVGDKERGRG